MQLTVTEDTQAVAPATWRFGPFEVTETGLDIHGRPSWDVWWEFGERLKFLERTLQFAIGDWAAWGEESFGEDAYAAFVENDYAESTIQTYASVARSVNRLIRVKGLTFAHHRVVASLRRNDRTHSPNTELQRDYLNKARENGWSAGKLREQIRADLGHDPAPVSRVNPFIQTMKGELAANDRGVLFHVDDEGTLIFVNDTRLFPPGFAYHFIVTRVDGVTP